MYTSDKDILDIAHGLRDRTLPKPEWTHNAHFAAAVWLIRSPLYDAERDMPAMIRRYNLACGVANTDTEGYHETITLASIRMASHALKGPLPSSFRTHRQRLHSMKPCFQQPPSPALSHRTEPPFFRRI